MGNTERGMAIVLVMGLAAVVTALTMAVVLATSTDTRIAAAFRAAHEVQAAADAGAQRGIVDLALMPDWTPALSGTVRSAFVDGPPGGVRQLADGSRVDIDLVASLANCGHAPPCTLAERQLVTASRPWGPNNPHWVPFAYGPLTALLPPGSAPSSSYLVVLVADDPAEQDGAPDVDGGSPGAPPGLILVRGEAFGPGGVHRAVELAVARPEPPAGVLRVLEWRALY